MFLRHKLRRKDGKEQRYWSIVENRRVLGGRTGSGTCCIWARSTTTGGAAWCRTIEALAIETSQDGRQIALFPRIVRRRR